MQKILILVALLVAVPHGAHAYVDPGILGSLYQALYVLIVGSVASWIFKPWRVLSAWLHRGDVSSAEPEKVAGGAEVASHAPDGVSGDRVGDTASRSS